MNVDPRSFFAEPARLHPRETRDLDVGREEHAANLTTDGVGRQVLLELGADDTRGTVRAHNLTPNRAVRRPLLLRLRLVHVAQLLTAVKGRRRAVVHALELDERRVVVLVGARALVTKNHAADVQSVVFKKKSGVSLKFVSVTLCCAFARARQPSQSGWIPVTASSTSIHERHATRNGW